MLNKYTVNVNEMDEFIDQTFTGNIGLNLLIVAPFLKVCILVARRDDDYTRQTQSMCSCCKIELSCKEMTLVFFSRKINTFLVRLN